jgi:two-component system nitrate/nitrite sensor histidine kinase NarX
MTLSSYLPRRLSTKIVSTLIAFLLIALCAIGTTLILSWQLEGSAATINEAGSLRMQGYRLSSTLAQLATPDARNAARDRMTQHIRAIDATFADLQRGDPQRPLYLPPGAHVHAAFDAIVQRWQTELRPIALASVNQAAATDFAAWTTYLARTESFVADVDSLVKLIEQDSEKRMFWLRSWQLVLIAMALIGTVVMIHMMYLLIIQPVTRLQDGMAQMNARMLGVRLPVESEDEFGQLTQGFNGMADRLETAYNELEDRVEQKTSELEDQNRELELLYDSASFLQRPQPLEALCQGFLQRITAYFNAEGGSVRVLEAERNNIHMVVRQGISEVLAEAEHCLKVGDCLCGEAVEKKISMVHNLHEMDRTKELACHREGFATVSVFHIHAHEQHIGFFNLHFRCAKVFDKREQALLETLGNLLGVAIENIRLVMREREMAVSEERNLVAQGLHDSIAQGLTFLNLQMQMLETSMHKGKMQEVEEIVPSLRMGIKESYDDIRELLLNFRSRLIKGDLINSLETTVEKFRAQTGTAVDFTVNGNGAPLPYEQQLQIMFIMQEALSNIRKHSLAKKVQIRLDDGQDFLLTIMDDGVGFDAATLLEKGESHVGIHIMRERAQRIHASFNVQSHTGKGTTVILQLPHDKRLAA